jgi:anti-sigma regulatory factor (Ser/Thr protein kinase)
VGTRPPGDERIILPAEVESLRRARRWMANIAEGLNAERLTDALLIVSELVANSLRHAHRCATRITLIGHVSPGCIRVTVDGGGGGAVVPRGDDADEAPGVGFLLAVRLADRLEFDAELGVVMFEIDVPA